ncbi:hypothetical protein M422DRAFT_218798 [Sphaerobolus stellatus SS14]|nr:hypothetical protein M422DRAFT_218798 [Sphaerobolus stellatus SS14]
MVETKRLNVYGRRGTRVVYIPTENRTPQASPFRKLFIDKVENAPSISPPSAAKLLSRGRRVKGHSTSPRGSPKSGNIFGLSTKKSFGTAAVHNHTPSRKPLGLKSTGPTQPSVVFMEYKPAPGTPTIKSTAKFAPFMDSKVPVVAANDTKPKAKKAGERRTKLGPITNIVETVDSEDTQIIRPPKGNKIGKRPIVLSDPEESEESPFLLRRSTRGNKANPIVISDNDNSDSDYVEPAPAKPIRRRPGVKASVVCAEPNTAEETRAEPDAPRLPSVSSRLIESSILAADPLTPLTDLDKSRSSLKRFRNQANLSTLLTELETSFEELSLSTSSGTHTEEITSRVLPKVTSKARVSRKPPAPRIAPHLKPLLKECEQQAPHDFTSFIETFPLHELHGSPSTLSFRKIAEASFSEVFAVGDIVLKVIPIRNEASTGQHQGLSEEEMPQESDAKDVLQEIVVTHAMGRVCSGFIKLLRTFVVVGRYPERLLSLWDQFNDRKQSENMRPDVFPSTQAYVLLALPNGGPDLEAYTFPIKTGWRQACSIFWQTSKALAIAEKSVSFEHRDLHWGQILVKAIPTTNRTSKGTRTRVRMPMPVGIGEFGELWMDHPSHGVTTTIIDLGLARMDAADTADNTEAVHYTPFDELIFEGEGDYQFDIYRLMRHAHSDGDWERYRPITNVMWLHYLTVKLIRSKRLRSPGSRSGTLSSSDFGEKQAYDCLTEMERLLEKSISQVRTKKGRAGSNKGLFGKAADVVTFAKERGWIG